MNEHLKETLENSEKDEEAARRIVIYKALEAELTKHKQLLYRATKESDIVDIDWINMQKEIIRILEVELKALND